MRGLGGKLPVSATIIAKNEADRISRTIRSVRDWADEIIVVDSGSADETVEIAQALGAKVFFNPWPGYGPQKRFAEALCRNKWVFNIDADEEVTPELEGEIRDLFASGSPPAKAFAVKTYCVFPFEDKPRRLAISMEHGRLYHTDFARFKDSTVHDSIVLCDGGKPVLLKHGLNHYLFRSHAHAVEKVNFYSSMQAEDLFRKGRNPAAVKIVLTPIWAFFKAYVLRGYFRYGVDGVIRSYIYAFSRLIRLAKTRERFQEQHYQSAKREVSVQMQAPGHDRNRVPERTPAL
ncbi:MAG TPA: glycosyltransferase family 2 protein [Micropepsaceae bacterium]|nr:glycosyltransferase family 2 protein [Micropepsaceae bacterium]